MQLPFRLKNGCSCDDDERTGVEATGLPDPSLLMYYSNLEDRIIWLDSPITVSSLAIVKFIHSVNREDTGIPVAERKPIRLMIHTDGGDLDVSFAIVDAILTSSTPVYTINAGSAISGGFIVLLAGHRRFCTLHSNAMIHPGSSKIGGTYDQIRSYADDYKRAVDDMLVYITSRTNLTREMLQGNWCGDMYFSSQEQLASGIVHEIIDPTNRAAIL